VVDADLLADALVEGGARAPPVGGANALAHRGVAEPERRALVAEQVAPASRARRLALAVDAVGDRAGAGNQHDAAALGRSGDQSDVGVVDDLDRLVAKAEPAQHGVEQRLVLVAIDAGDAEADRRHLAVDVERLENLVERLLHRQLAVRHQVGAAAARLAQHHAALVGEQPHRLGAAGVDADDQPAHPPAPSVIAEKLARLVERRCPGLSS
jgi:hypothetical protein